ncbi:hypothetical protein [Chryseobacterium sp.]|uniref:hypothetical protein n=1 Tax=Chryseobacterium sp. TaxID=1871047 RepID=UPI0012A82524|nr:hypothetical protein [Chryseobacterium sp.]QFG53143.1 hypothetical protein F7R58_06150 [Chryseobacterium sp.]
MIKKIIAVPAGVLAGGLGIYLIETLGHKLYPLPAGIDRNDMDAMASYVSTAPFMALFFVILAYAVGALLSGYISTKVSADGKMIYALICGLVFLLQTIYMMYSMPTPAWFWVAGVLVWSLVWVGYRLADNSKIIKR